MADYNEAEFARYLRHKVYNEKGEFVSGCAIELPATRLEIEEYYAKACGWANATAMRKYYPLDDFKFEIDCSDCGHARPANLVGCGYCGRGY